MPNASYGFSGVLLCCTLGATRNIAAGEEITISYIDVEQPRKDRLEELKRRYNFDCTCGACLDTSGKSDKTRMSLCVPISSLEFISWHMNKQIKFLLEKADLCSREGYISDLHKYIFQLSAVYACAKDAKNVKRWGYKLFLLGAYRCTDRSKIDELHCG